MLTGTDKKTTGANASCQAMSLKMLSRSFGKQGHSFVCDLITIQKRTLTLSAIK